MHACISCVSLCECVWVCVIACLCVCLCACMYYHLCVCVCTHACACAHTHTHTPMPASTIYVTTHCSTIDTSTNVTSILWQYTCSNWPTITVVTPHPFLCLPRQQGTSLTFSHRPRYTNRSGMGATGQYPALPWPWAPVTGESGCI